MCFAPFPTYCLVGVDIHSVTHYLAKLELSNLPSCDHHAHISAVHSMQSSESDWAGLPAPLLQVQRERPADDTIAAHGRRSIPFPPCLRLAMLPCARCVPCNLTVSHAAMQIIAARLQYSGHRRRMQLTCRDWAAAAKLSCIKLEVTETEADERHVGLLGVLTCHSTPSLDASSDCCVGMLHADPSSGCHRLRFLICDINCLTLRWLPRSSLNRYRRPTPGRQGAGGAMQRRRAARGQTP